MTPIKVLGVGAAAIILSACSQTALVNQSYLSDNYNPYLLSYAAKRGGMVTEIVGNPFQSDKASVDQTVTETFRDHHFGPDLEFLATPSDEATGEDREAFRVVVLFNPAPNANSAKLCSRNDRPQAPAASERLRVMAAFCNTDTRVSAASGSIGEVASPDDPAFKNMMKQVALALFPPQAPDNRNDREFEVN